MKYIFALGAAALAFAHPAFAADDADSPDDIVVTATGFDRARSETGQAISVINRNDLERMQSASVLSALTSVPSLSAAQRGGMGAQSSLFIRGGNSSQTLVMIDGVRVNDPSSPNGAFDFGALTAGNVDRIEVLRGPNSIVWGSQAIGGVVNIRNAEPGEDFAGRAMLEYGRYDTLRGSANLSGKSGIASFSLGGGFARTDGISALAAGTERDGYRNWSLNGRVKLALAESVSLDLRGFFNKGRVQYDAQFAAIPDTLSESRDRTFTLYAGLNADLADSRWQNKLAYTRTDVEREGTDPDTIVIRVPAVPGALCGPLIFACTVPLSVPNYNNFTYAGTVDRLEYRSSFALSDPLELLFGAEYEHSDASNLFPANGTTVPDSASTSAASGYAQLVAKPIDGLTLTGGVRYDDFADYGSKTSFGGNLAYTPNGGDTVLRATFAEGFRAPTLTESLLPFGNRNLKAEAAQSFDIGIEQAFLDKRVVLSLTGFRRTSSNQITYNFATFQSENVEKVRASGLEAELTARPTDALLIKAQYALVNARDLSTGLTLGKRLERRPQHSASLSADWTGPQGLTLGGTLSVRGDSFENRSNSVQLQGFTLVSLRASYPVMESVTLFARVENLGDVQYQTVRGYGSLGRNAHVGVRARF